MNDFPTCAEGADIASEILTCDLAPGHPGDLHWDAIDGIYWKIGEPGGT